MQAAGSGATTCPGAGSYQYRPCVMCSGAIRWARIPRVVYGTPQNMGGQFQEIPCREILERIAPQTEVIGPVLQEEGREIRSGFRRRDWKGKEDRPK